MLIKKILQPWIPKNLITDELGGLYGSSVLSEMGQIIEYYNVYNNGADFPLDNSGEYSPSDVRYKLIRSIIDKEARFMFGKSPEIKITPIERTDDSIAKTDTYSRYITEILKHNHFNAALLKAARDCFIGKRIAVFCNFDNEYGITVTFAPALEFVYDVDTYDKSVLKKIVAFYQLNSETRKQDQRIYKKKYEMVNGLCHITEGIYDGSGNVIEMKLDDAATEFPYIPAAVILNDGLTGDLDGESDVLNLYDYESAYSRLSNADINAERKSMNPVYWTMDADHSNVPGGKLSIAPGAYWDLQTSADGEAAKGSLGILESGLTYSGAISQTLERLRSIMYEQVDMPLVNAADLKGIITSGKALKSIYWSLILRCQEKFLAWKPQLEYIIKCLIDGAFYYPEAAAKYTDEPLQNVDYTIDITNRFPLPEDEDEKKSMELAEVAAKAKSIKTYIKNNGIPVDEDAEEEIKQIVAEKRMLEDMYEPEQIGTE